VQRSVVWLVTAGLYFAACGLDDGEKNRCNVDADCNPGRVCRAGVCDAPGTAAAGVDAARPGDDGTRDGAMADAEPLTDAGSGAAAEDACARDPACRDPFANDYCAGPPLSEADVSARLADGSSVDLARVRVLSRSRLCPDAGCGPWQADARFSFVRLAGSPALPYEWLVPLAGTARLGHSEISPSLALQVTSDDAVTDDGATNVDDLRVECLIASGTCRSWAEYWRNGTVSGAPTVLVGEERAAFSGIVTDHCLRFFAAGSFAQASGRIENQVVVAATY
jgi:hypothetical protein